MEKSVVLIDAQNLLKGWLGYRKEEAKLDYKKLVDKLGSGTNLLRAYFYDGVSDSIDVKKKNFLEALQRQGIQLRTKMLRRRFLPCNHCGHSNERWVQKGVDVCLATDILRHAWQKTCEICIVVSGDEDYKDAIDVAKDKGVKVWVASFRKSLSRELQNTADKVIFLEDIFEEIKRP